ARRGDGAVEKRPVVARIVPSHAARIDRIVPECLEEFQRFERLLAADRHAPLLVTLDRSEAPEIGIAEAQRVAPGVRDCLTDRMPGRLPSLALAPQVLPRLWPLLGPRRLEIGLARSKDHGRDRVRYGREAAIERRVGLRVVDEAAVLRLESGADVRDV